MKLKIISIEPDYASFPAVSVAAKVGVMVDIKEIVTYQILGVEGTTTSIEGKIYTKNREASIVLQEVKKDAIAKIGQFNYYKLPGQEFELVPVVDLINKEFDLGDNR